MSHHPQQIRQITTRGLWSKRYREAIKALRRISKRERESERLLCSYGILYDHLALEYGGKRRQQYEKKAKEYYLAALALNPKSLRALYGLGRILVHRGDPQALKWYRKARDIAPNNQRAQLAYATALLSLGKAKETRRELLSQWRRFGPSFHLAYNIASAAFVLKNERDKKYYARRALSFWQKKPKQIRKSHGGRAFEKAIRKMLST